MATTNKGIEIQEESPYNPEFVAKIERIYDDYKSGKTKSITLDPNDIWGSLGLK
ncbi:hypothetical protein KHA90_15045 [Flavobacterium psychroterrae]|uniref:Uncharacterized protein n=1 Tax=Flavobacterium psychroterrae TaxID=2133767 RepID=A0ABS5PEN3_9FLAO|nr:DUF2683 family protein [Flavobacterium psychroterrae]MBS7232340.1 hypothetical protein [Flavobacterium psychroterrae]